MSVERTLWFGAGPARWPEEVLERAGECIGPDSESGLSVLELSHRGPGYRAIHERVLGRLRRLLELPQTHDVLLLPGGATSQFAMLPVNLRPPGHSADYVLTGSWSKKAAAHARATGAVRVAATGESGSFRDVPPRDEWTIDDDASYVHITTNNTIFGTQIHDIPETMSVPVVADASSDILTRDLPLDRLALVYAGAQKCIGPAGLAIVVIRRDLLERAGDDVPSFWRYRDHAAAGSLLNTPPTALVWLADLMLEWVERQGGVAEMTRRAEERSRIVYAALDAHPEVFETVAGRVSRSRTNITFRLRDAAQEPALLELTRSARIGGLAGHRSVGGFRISMYTAMPVEGAKLVASLLEEHAGRAGAAGA